MIDLAPLLRACAFSLWTNRRLGMRTSTDLHYIACQFIRSSIPFGWLDVPRVGKQAERNRPIDCDSGRKRRYFCKLGLKRCKDRGEGGEKGVNGGKRGKGGGKESGV